MKKSTLLCLMVFASCIITQAQSVNAPIIDNTLDSLQLVKTARPVPGSSRVDHHPVLFLVGNSTMRNGTLGNGNNGQWGWGYFAGEYFDPAKITVENHALGGLSSRTFYESFWKPVINAVKPGDYVVIQLGHNDSGPYDSGRARNSIKGIGKDSIQVTVKETGVKRTVYTYGEYMRKFVNETRAKGGIPILATITPRPFFGDDNRIRRPDTHPVWARQIAQELNVPLIDMNETVSAKYDKYGRYKTGLMFYGDQIHTGALGASLNAESFAEDVRANPQLTALAAMMKPAHVPYESPVRKDGHPVLFPVGDSTVRNADSDPNGMWGWGSVIGRFFDENKITVDNQAMAGRSARTFMDEGRWQKVYEALRPGDYVLIQFGHNDGGPVNYDRARGDLVGTGMESMVFKMPNGINQVVYTFGWYLRKFATDAIEKGAKVILLSHTPRNQFDRQGRIIRNTQTYGLWTKQAALETGAFYIDLNAISADKLDKLPQDTIATYFKNDHTHSSLRGALSNAESIVDGLKRARIPLVEYLKPNK